VRDHELVDRLAAAATARRTHVQPVGGWEVRIDPELPFQRSNCAIPFGDGSAFDVDARVDDVEARYRTRGRVPRVQIVPSADPADLDARLARRGYVVEAPVDVLVADLTTMILASSPPCGHGLVVDSRLNWPKLASFADDERALVRLEGYARLLTDIAADHCVASADVDGECAAHGIGVVDRGWLGVFGMFTRHSARRHGAARAVLRALADRALTDGATRAYLQVETDNVGAQQLYSSAGFRYSHSYHYRVLR
jgi:GNAT superfamily N-acetyltransferase